MPRAKHVPRGRRHGSHVLVKLGMREASQPAEGGLAYLPGQERGEFVARHGPPDRRVQMFPHD